MRKYVDKIWRALSAARFITCSSGEIAKPPWRIKTGLYAGFCVFSKSCKNVPCSAAYCKITGKSRLNSRFSSLSVSTSSLKAAFVHLLSPFGGFGLNFASKSATVVTLSLETEVFFAVVGPVLSLAMRVSLEMKRPGGHPPGRKASVLAFYRSLPSSPGSLHAPLRACL